jgi:hypothetical protein
VIFKQFYLPCLAHASYVIVPRDRTILAYCAGGCRSSIAASLLRRTSVKTGRHPSMGSGKLAGPMCPGFVTNAGQRPAMGLTVSHTRGSRIDLSAGGKVLAIDRPCTLYIIS